MTFSFDRVINRSKFLKKIRNDNNVKKILLFISGFLLILVFSLSISLESIKPFNYITIAITGLFVLSSSFYILIYGKLYIDTFSILIFVFLLLQYVSFFVNLFPYYTQTPTLMCFLSFFVYEFFKQLVNKKKFLRYLCLSTIFFIFLFTIKYFKAIIHPVFSNRIGDFFGNENDVARHLSFSFLSMLILLYYSKRISLKIIFGGISLYAFYLILLTGSISNTLVSLICCLVFIYFLVPKNYKWVFLISLVSFILLFIILINLPSFSYFKKRILSILNSFFDISGVYTRDKSSEGRFYGAIYGLKLFFQNPIFGNGYRSVYREFYIMSHNNISEIAADFGIFALLCEETIILIPLIKGRGKKDLEVIILNSFILVFQLFLVSYNSKVESFILPITFGIVNYDLRFLRRNENYVEINI